MICITRILRADMLHAIPTDGSILCRRAPCCPSGPHSRLGNGKITGDKLLRYDFSSLQYLNTAVNRTQFYVGVLHDTMGIFLIIVIRGRVKPVTVKAIVLSYATVTSCRCDEFITVIALVSISAYSKSDVGKPSPRIVSPLRSEDGSDPILATYSRPRYLSTLASYVAGRNPISTQAHQVNIAAKVLISKPYYLIIHNDKAIVF